jgi:hypothetical protein
MHTALKTVAQPFPNVQMNTPFFNISVCSGKVIWYDFTHTLIFTLFYDVSARDIVWRQRQTDNYQNLR